MSWRGYEYGCALRNAKQIAEQIGHRRGLEEGQTAADVTNKLTERSVKDWADSMIAEFTKGAAVKAIFCDEDPEREVQFSLAEFNQAVDDHLGQIKPDVRAKLSAYEQLSRESDALDERFDSLQHNLTTSAIEIAQCVVLARKEEMGLRVEEGPHLTNGRRILEEVRAMPVSLNDQQKETLKTCLQLLDQGTS